MKTSLSKCLVHHQKFTSAHAQAMEWISLRPRKRKCEREKKNKNRKRKQKENIPQFVPSLMNYRT